ncbi:hypothetical protein RJT34_30262 [Clitoria ternatea]|uniref:Protein kinase domain-containing protein n=1 Tax=Clitoria ternatea TaxID=43366 RepID=A0AAN9ESR7_CLITE
MAEELLMSDSEIKASRTIRLVLLSFGFPVDLTSFVRQHSVWLLTISLIFILFASGYMAPEYAIDGNFSVKSDVFSFGILMLEIISGKKNIRSNQLEESRNLIGYAWDLWTERRPLEMIGECLKDSCNLSEAVRCIHISLLCLQQHPHDRPTMSSMVMMLSSEISLSQPKPLAVFVGEHSPHRESSSSYKNDLPSEYPVGTYKNVSGSDRALCHDCPPQGLPHRALYIPVRGAVAETPCLYKCISDRYHMPNCYTSAEFYTEFLIWKPIVGHRRAWSSIVGIYHLVAATSDLMLAYLDFFLGGDEKRSDLPPHLHQRFPMCIIFGGDGSYMSLFSLHNDNILTSIMS